LLDSNQRLPQALSRMANGPLIT